MVSRKEIGESAAKAAGEYLIGILDLQERLKKSKDDNAGTPPAATQFFDLARKEDLVHLATLLSAQELGTHLSKMSLS
jgi:hypothetical protein